MQVADFMRPEVFVKEKEAEVKVGDRADNGAIFTDERELPEFVTDMDRRLYFGVDELLQSSELFRRKSGISYLLKQYRLKPSLRGTPFCDFLFSPRQLEEYDQDNTVYITPVEQKLVLHEQSTNSFAHVPFFPGHQHSMDKDSYASRAYNFRHWGNVKALFVTNEPVTDGTLNNVRNSGVMIDGVVYPQFANTTQSRIRTGRAGLNINYFGCDGADNGLIYCNRCFGSINTRRLLDPNYVSATNDDYTMYIGDPEYCPDTTYRSMVSPASAGDLAGDVANTYMLKTLAHYFNQGLFSPPESEWEDFSINDYDWALNRWNFGLFSGPVNSALIARNLNSQFPIILTGDVSQECLARFAPKIEFWKEPWDHDIEAYGRRHRAAMDSNECPLVYTTTPLNSIFFVIDHVLERAKIDIPVTEQAEKQIQTLLRDNAAFENLIPRYLRIRYLHQLLDRLRNTRFLIDVFRRRTAGETYKGAGTLPEKLRVDLEMVSLSDTNWAIFFSEKEQEVLLTFFSELNYDDYRYGIDQVNRYAWSLLLRRSMI